MRTPLLLIALALAAFGLSLSGSFHFDDYSLFSVPVRFSDPLQTRPLTYLTFWMNETLGGREPFGYHAVNLLLHCLAVWLLWDVLRRLLPPRVAVFAAALFAIHPIQAEAVNYIWARSSLLATVLCLASWRAWVTERRWTAVAWFAAALLAKEECVTFPVFLLLWGWAGPLMAPLAAMFGLSLAAGVRTLLATATVKNIGVNAGIGPLDYLLAQGPVILRYLRMLFIPWGFSVDPEIARPPLWLALVCWLTIATLAAVTWRTRAGKWVAGGLVLLAASSSIFPAQDLAADRRMYLPMIAFAAAVAVGLAGKLGRLAVPVGLALIGLSIWRCDIWLTERSLWTEAFTQAPDKLRPRIQLARALPPREAEKILLPVATSSKEAASELGKLLLQAERPQDALRWFGRALAISPRDAEAVNNRGVALQALGQSDASRHDFFRALELNPCLYEARLNLALLKIPAPPATGCIYTDAQQRELAGAP